MHLSIVKLIHNHPQYIHLYLTPLHRLYYFYLHFCPHWSPLAHILFLLLLTFVMPHKPQFLSKSHPVSISQHFIITLSPIILIRQYLLHDNNRVITLALLFIMTMLHVRRHPYIAHSCQRLLKIEVYPYLNSNG